MLIQAAVLYWYWWGKACIVHLCFLSLIVSKQDYGYIPNPCLDELNNQVDNNHNYDVIQ